MDITEELELLAQHHEDNNERMLEGDEFSFDSALLCRRAARQIESKEKLIKDLQDQVRFLDERVTREVGASVVRGLLQSSEEFIEEELPGDESCS